MPHRPDQLNLFTEKDSPGSSKPSFSQRPTSRARKSTKPSNAADDELNEQMLRSLRIAFHRYGIGSARPEDLHRHFETLGGEIVLTTAKQPTTYRRTPLRRSPLLHADLDTQGGHMLKAKAERHLATYRPRQYRRLKREGKLQQHLDKCVSQCLTEYDRARAAGLNKGQQDELALSLILPPAEGEEQDYDQ
jgi:hypothetical protein